MDRDELLKLIGDDELGILKNKPSIFSRTADNRLAEKFAEITEFVRDNSRLPEANKNDLHEMDLFNRLNGLRSDESKMEKLRPFDELGLLTPAKKIEQVSDILGEDSLGILKDDDDIFTLRHIAPSKAITNAPDFVARRTPCKDFDKFEESFKGCHDDLKKGRRTMMPFDRGSFIAKGDFFVLRGVLVYVADEGKRTPTADRNTFNARLRCIFENGTESDLLLRSLAAALYKEDGRRVSTSTDELFQKANQVKEEEDVEAGTLYILRSLSTNPAIKATKNLYKIGFTRGNAELRIKNAATDPTYLMAGVSIVSTYTCYNLNAQKLEFLLHTFFAKVALDVELVDKKGRPYSPKEWFVAPLAVIEQAIELLRTGAILNYRYNPETQLIDLREKGKHS